MTVVQILTLFAFPVLGLMVGGLVYWTNTRFNR